MPSHLPHLAAGDIGFHFPNNPSRSPFMSYREPDPFKNSRMPKAQQRGPIYPPDDPPLSRHIHDPSEEEAYADATPCET